MILLRTHCQACWDWTYTACCSFSRLMPIWCGWPGAQAPLHFPLIVLLSVDSDDMSTLNALLGYPRMLLGRGVSAPTSRPQSTTDEAQLNPTTGQSPRRERSKAALNRIIDVLDTTKEFSSACEPLELAISALLVVLKAFKKYIDAMEALENLLVRMDSLQAMLHKVQEAGYDKCPDALKKRLKAFADNVQAVVDDAKALQSRRRIVRFINASDYNEQVEDWVKKLSCWKALLP
ncbi:hypothetical protein FKP32DRAFT_458141 [Trametes sanguinea]|nr:hypothetical protein FKP32DRAFT_458141 [Trametes sanguinea]